ncbi:MAG: Ldh family oxidoreductase [Chlorobi bacterium]|nr:Ldh family oxidoreductase [Chlorobiota bacterium]
MTDPMFIKVSYKELINTIYEVLINNGLETDKAQKVAEVIANSTLDGINSHGINRLPSLIEYIERGYVSVTAEPEVVSENHLSVEL